MSDEQRPNALRSALRWGAVLAIAGAFSYGGVRVFDGWRANAARRVFVQDWAQFEGCMFGATALEDTALPDAALALAKGTGDALWPHSCARALTRVANAATAIAFENSAETPLKSAATAMESALGEAVFWSNHVQAHRVEPPAWVHAFVRLRTEVRAWAQRNHAALATPIVPANRRVPRAINEPEDPPPPEPVAGGAEADVVAAITTPTQLAWIFRDRRSRYARCAMGWSSGAAPSPVRCGAMNLGERGDPRDLGFAASDGASMIVASERPPSDLRRLLTIDGFEPALEIAGASHASRDFVITNQVAWGVHRARFSLALRRTGGEIALPADADALYTDRALGISSGRALYGWLRVARGGRGVFRWFDASNGQSGQLPLQGDWSSYERTLDRCVRGAETLWLARDSRGAAQVFASQQGAVRELARLATGVGRELQFACSATRWALVAKEPTRIRVRVFNDAQELPSIDAAVSGASDALFAGESLWVADGGGADGALRVRVLPGDRTLLARRSYPVLPAPRGVRLLGDGSRVLILARAEQTHAFVAPAEGAELAAAVLATVEPAPPAR